jgi:hypothetical protein
MRRRIATATVANPLKHHREAIPPTQYARRITFYEYSPSASSSIPATIPAAALKKSKKRKLSPLR